MFRNNYFNNNIPSQLGNDYSLIRDLDDLWNETSEFFSQSPLLNMDDYGKHNSDSNDNYQLSDDYYSSIIEEEKLPSGDIYPSMENKILSDDSSDDQPLKRKASTNSEQLKKRICATKFNGNINITGNISVNCSNCKIEMNWEECSVVDEKNYM